MRELSNKEIDTIAGANWLSDLYGAAYGVGYGAGNWARNLFTDPGAWGPVPNNPPIGGPPGCHLQCNI